MPVAAPSRLTEPAPSAATRAQAAPGVVSAAGGDGTLNAVAGTVLGQGVPFGILPQGTFNYFGRRYGISQDTEVALRGFLQGHLQPVQVGHLNGRLFLVNASLGLYPTLLEDREAYKQRFGRSRLVALWSGIVTLLRAPRQLRRQLESWPAAAWWRWRRARSARWRCMACWCAACSAGGATRNT
ncbi:hypothetical protein G6F59_015349 [Rhizopus arrhizus]|nr:hypothetical protein G6F59_015349 [Rhizopus arrhizus]